MSTAPAGSKATAASTQGYYGKRSYTRDYDIDCNLLNKKMSHNDIPHNKY